MAQEDLAGNEFFQVFPLTLGINAAAVMVHVFALMCFGKIQDVVEIQSIDGVADAGSEIIAQHNVGKPGLVVEVGNVALIIIGGLFVPVQAMVSGFEALGPAGSVPMDRIVQHFHKKGLEFFGFHGLEQVLVIAHEEEFLAQFGFHANPDDFLDQVGILVGFVWVGIRNVTHIFHPIGPGAQNPYLSQVRKVFFQGSEGISNFIKVPDRLWSERINRVNSG